MLTGQNGILTQAQNAKKRTKESENEEAEKLAYNEAQILNIQYNEMTIFEINDKVDLLAIQYLANDFNRNFDGKEVKIMQDIDISGIEWKPIESFMGTMDGQNHIIKGLNSKENGFIATMNEDDSNKTVEIRNLHLTNVNIQGTSSEGGGGLVGGAGHNYYGGNSPHNIIKNCSVQGNIKGGFSAGGIVGTFSNGEFQECTFSGNVEGETAVGGLIGTAGYGGAIYMRNSAFQGGNIKSITSGKVGGLCGYLWLDSTIENGYVYNAEITSEGGNTGIISGYLQNERTQIFRNLYTNNKECNDFGNNERNDAIEKIESSDFLKQETFKNFDFDKIWEISDNSIPKIRKDFIY